MQNGLTAFNGLRRPPLLIRAARIGMAGYDRSAHLARHLGQGPLPRAGDALMPLIEIEAGLEADRKGRAAHYQAARHVDVLIAMIGEVRHLQGAQAVEA
ncbi:DUF6477 family protein [Roseovarius sp. D22-M7]|uniref:DUF6477 family protein n=1 Tax=Roseovarius sp. D22-M7 TaxID=3127116 RepID=UPI00300F9E8E